MVITGIGRIGKDVELRYISSGTAVANLSLAFSYGQKQADGRRLTQWIECSLWGKQAEALAQYLKKGNQVSIIADGPHIKGFTRDDGSQGNELIANIINIELIGGQQEEQQKRTAQQTEEKEPEEQGEPFDDDIPF